jgi:hypothetical protein
LGWFESRAGISEIAKRQNGDMGVATEMYITNKESGVERYKSGGLNKTAGYHYMDGTFNKPELILNAKDTPNMLKMLSITRDVMSGTGINNYMIPKTNNNNNSETWNIEIKEVKTNDAKKLLQNMKSIARAKK